MRPEINVKDDGVYGINDACRALSVSRSTIYRYINAGELKYKVRRVNGRRVIKGIDLRILFNRFL